MSWLPGVLLVIHGVVHVVVALAPSVRRSPERDAPGSGPPAIGRRSAALAVAAGALFVAAGAAALAQLPWWSVTAVVAAVLSASLMAATFTPWWLPGLAADAAVLVLASPAVLSG